MKDIFKFSAQPEFENPSLIVGWEEDAGRLSPKVIECLNKKLQAQSFCEIEPAGFFSLGGVAIEDNVAQFPENKFYSSDRKDLVIFKGNEPRYERYRFLNEISDLAQHSCRIRELYTIGGTISPIAHSSSRRILAVFNQYEFQKRLRGYGLEDMDWKGPPAINSYLLWTAKRRGIAGVSLWAEIPFYLAAGEDFQAIKTILLVLDKKFKLDLDFGELNEQIRDQNEKISRLREDDQDIDKYIGMLESELSLSREEQMELSKKVTEFLEKG